MPASKSATRPPRVLSFQGTPEEQLEQQRYHRNYLHFLVGWRDDKPSKSKYRVDEGRIGEIEAEVRLLAEARPVRQRLSSATGQADRG